MKAILISVVVLIFIGLGIWYYMTPSKWIIAKSNPNGSGSFMFIRKRAGNIECATLNGKDCMFFNTQKDASSVLSTIDIQPIKPLACGSAHKAVWGNSGYDQVGHWCNQVL